MSNIIIKKENTTKVKVFQYNTKTEGIVEGNTVQIPFVAEYKGERQNIVKYRWTTKEKGAVVKRGLDVLGHVLLGVPTLREYDVLVALQRIFLSQKTEKGLCELRTEDIDNEYLTIEFSIYKLAKEMGYKSPNTLVTNNLKKSIDILLATTIENKFNGCIYDVSSKKYLVAGQAFHLLESVEQASLYENNIEVKNIMRVRLSRFTYDSIVNNYKIFYNKNIYTKTKNLMAKKIYHMALKWKGNNDFAWVNINTLMEKIPMIESQEKYRKRYIKNALKILNDKKILKIKYDENNKDLVYFIFNEDYKKEARFLLTKYNKFSEIRDGFYSFGFMLDEIDDYLNVQDIRYIQALLRYAEVKNNAKKLKNPKQYIKRCLRKKIKIDEKYYNKDGD